MGPTRIRTVISNTKIIGKGRNTTKPAMMCRCVVLR